MNILDSLFNMLKKRQTGQIDEERAACSRQSGESPAEVIDVDFEGAKGTEAVEKAFEFLGRSSFSPFSFLFFVFFKCYMLHYVVLNCMMFCFAFLFLEMFLLLYQRNYTL